MKTAMPSNDKMVSVSQPSVSAKPTTKSIPVEDDRYPGSFFRVPGLPTPGKTTWSAR